MVGDKVRKVVRNPLWLLSRTQTRGEQRQRQGVQLGATAIIQMRCNSGLDKGGSSTVGVSDQILNIF